MIIHFSKRLLDSQHRAQLGERYVNSTLAHQQFRFSFRWQSYHLQILYNLRDSLLCDLAYSGELPFPENALLLSYFDLISDKTLSELSPISAKEVDFYLRDNPQGPIFHANTAHELVMIDHLQAALVEHIKSNQINNQSDRLFYDKEKWGEFQHLPVSLQWEMVEEFWSLYPKLTENFEVSEIEFPSLKIAPVHHNDRSTDQVTTFDISPDLRRLLLNNFGLLILD
jgi:hypothetical protein